MGEIIKRNWDLTDFGVQVNLPSRILPVGVLFQGAITPRQACHNQIKPSGTRDISYPLVVTSCSSSSLISLFLVQNSTIIAEYQVMSSRSMSPYHDCELTPSTAYIECSIHRLQYSPKIVCLPFMIMIAS
jgi:hypothetical protein